MEVEWPDEDPAGGKGGGGRGTITAGKRLFRFAKLNENKTEAIFREGLGRLFWPIRPEKNRIL